MQDSLDGSDSREAKRADEILRTKQEELMGIATPQEAMSSIKTEDPRRWCEITMSMLNGAVAEYNKMARSYNRNNDDELDVIVAFTMTETEEEEFISGLDISDDES
jgi:hypothetical protein